MGDRAPAAKAGLQSAVRTRPATDGPTYLVRTDGDIRLLIDWLHSQLPYSDKVFHTLRQALTPYRQHLHLSIYADSLSHDTLTTVLTIYGPGNAHTAKAQQHQTNPHPPPQHPHQPSDSTPPYPADAYNVAFHTTHFAAATSLLRQCVDLTRPLEFAGIGRQHRALVEALGRWYEAAQADEVQVELEYDECNHWDYPFVVAPASSGASPAASLAAAVRFARLPATMETGATIAAHWPYASAGTPALIYNLLLAAESDSRPASAGSYGAYRDNQLVAWEVKQPYGAIGMLHVKDSERRSGVGRQLIRRVVEIALQNRQQHRAAQNGSLVSEQQSVQEATDGRVRVYDEYTPFCYTNESNAASRGLFESLGFENRFEIDWIVWKPTVRYSAAGDG